MLIVPIYSHGFLFFWICIGYDQHLPTHPTLNPPPKTRRSQKRLKVKCRDPCSQARTTPVLQNPSPSRTLTP